MKGIAIALLVVVCGCQVADEPELDRPEISEPDDQAPEPGTASGIPVPAQPTDLAQAALPPTGPLRIDGSYRVISTWDLTSALAADSLGDLLATLLIEEAAGALGLPSFLEDDAAAALSAVAHDPIADFIDDHTPDVLDPSTGVLAELAAVLANVEVESQLTLAQGSDGTTITGTEAITAVRLHLGQSSISVPIEQLIGVAGGTSIEADVSGQLVDRERVVIADRSLVMVSDPLVALGLSGLLSIDDLTTYAAQVIDCQAAVDALTGGGSLTLSFAGRSVSISGSTLVSACESVRGAALEELLGFFQTDLGVVTGGPLTLHDDSADLVVDRITSAEGYRGIIESLPTSLQAPFAIELTGTRQ